jgi:hypothetical protein
MTLPIFNCDSGFYSDKNGKSIDPADIPIQIQLPKLDTRMMEK